MDFFTQLNKVGKFEEAYLPVNKLSELSLEKDYRITGVRKATTKFGSRIIVDVEETFSCFLPARYAKAFAENSSLFEQMVKASKDCNLCMRYKGGQYNDVEFKPCADL